MASTMNLLLRATQGCFALTFLLSLLLVASVPLWSAPGVLTASALAGLTMGVLAPRLGFALGLLLLPLGGNRPGTVHFIGSVIFGAALLTGAVIGRRTLRMIPSPTNLPIPLLFASVLYGLISLLSLSSIPLPHLLDELRNLINLSSAREIATSLHLMLETNEHTLLYSILSVYLTLLSIALGFVAFQLCRGEPDRTPRLFLGAIGGGLLLSAALGLLDYYGVVSLGAIRPLDPIVNPGERQFRLQSLFAHSGWYAEYVTLTIPTALLLLSLRLRFSLRVVTLLLVALLGEFILILTYQRGGWLSYPLTLIAMWSAIYVVQRLERGEHDVLTALRRSLVKVAISLPLTIIVSLSLLLVLSRGEGDHDRLAPYMKRLADIQRTGDRTDFLLAGVLLGVRHPFLGGGADSFATQFNREVVDPKGELAGRFNLPLHGSAHNVYAQTFSGKGLAGLATLIALPLLLIYLAFVMIRDRDATIERKLYALTGACFGCAFLIYGNVQEVFYVQVLQFLFFTVIGVIAAVVPARPVSKHGARRILLALGAILLLHLAWEFIFPGHTRYLAAAPREFGCYPPEISPEGQRFRWCAEHAAVSAPAEAPLTLHLAAGPEPVVITAALNRSGPPASLTLPPGGRGKLTVAGAGGGVVRLRANGSFIPRARDAGSTDNRRLAFRILEEGP